MSSALFTSLSALRSHQDWIDVIGNNLANANTPGFKSSTLRFMDNFSRTLSGAVAPNGGLGGRNPSQVGQGVGVGSVVRAFEQGALSDTGRTFDLAMEGNGFFGVTDGATNYYTRVGTFGLDSFQNLVDISTGYQVLNPNYSPISIDTEGAFPPSATGEIEVKGNLPAEITGPLAEVLTGASPFKHGYPASLSGTATGSVAIPAGETWTMDVVINGGAPQTVQIAGSASGVTMADIATAIDGLSDVTASLNSSGSIVLASELTGADVTMKINPGVAGKDLALGIGIPTALVTGSESALIPGTTTLNDLPGNLTNYQPGDVIDISGVDTDGSPTNASFRYGATSSGFDGETVDSFVAYIDSLYSDANVSLNATGQIVVEAQTAGESDLLLSISDSPSQAGKTNWTTYAATQSTEGTGPDTVVTSTEVYDSSGLATTLTLTYERQTDASWTITPTLLDGAGSVTSGPITGLQFDENGVPVGLGAVNNSVSILFAGASSPQTVSVDLGTEGEPDGLTQFGSDPDVYVSAQDGYGSGELSSIDVLANGEISGFYSNGQSRTLGQVGVATFANSEGLASVGDNLWGETPNSGSIVMGIAGVGSSGRVVGGALESSNVSTAEQFVHLIEAQRGYQASSRVISIQDEIMAETVNLI
ncbi:MAG: flagellar hook protein FlgE [Planctomycetota bacterium]|jgi:flagellar hook protein FlgE